jgi:SAM-dependent methyltransferase
MSTRETFDRVAARYDSLKLHIIPGYVEMRAAVDRIVDAAPSTLGRALELGSGTGSWASAYLQRHGGAQLVGVEYSSGMRDVASHQLAGFGHRVRLVQVDMKDGLPEAGSFDCTASILAIHHVPDKGRIAREVFERLVPGGLFAWADVTTAATPEGETAAVEDWIAFMRSQGMDEAGIEGVLEDHRQNDLPETVEAMLEHLHRAGFEPAEPVWERGKFVVLRAEKP